MKKLVALCTACTTVCLFAGKETVSVLPQEILHKIAQDFVLEATHISDHQFKEHNDSNKENIDPNTDTFSSERLQSLYPKYFNTTLRISASCKAGCYISEEMELHAKQYNLQLEKVGLEEFKKRLTKKLNKRGYIQLKVKVERDLSRAIQDVLNENSELPAS